MKFIKKTPVRIQIDPIECGAVCLGIILEYFESFVSGQKLRELAKTSLTGTNAKSIIDAASALGLKAKAHKAFPDELKKTKTPAILFFDQCHFVVYEGYFWGRFYINDPALGRYSLAKDVFRRRFSRVLIEITKPEQLLKVSKPSFALSPELKINLSSLGIFSAVLFAVFSAFSGLLAARGHELLFSMPAIFGSFLIIFGLGFLVNAWLLKIFFEGHSIKESQELLEGLSKAPSDFFRNLPFKVFAESFESSFSTLSKMVQNTARRYFVGTFLAVILLIIGLISPLTLGVFLLAVILCPVWFSKNSTAKMTVKPHLSVASDLRAMGQEELLVDGLLADLKACPAEKHHHLWALWLLAIIMSLSFIWGEAWQQGLISLSEIFALQILLFASISLVIIAKKQPVNLEFLSLKQELLDIKESPKALSIFEDLLAVVVFDHTKSLFDHLGLDHFRVGHINDESDLFEGSLKDNLCLFIDTKEADLVKALELALATDLFYNRPLGLLTPIFAHGKNLSHSEKKRLLLAQALIKKPDVLVLEDFFSVLDSVTALKILRNLKAHKIPTIFTSYREQEIEEAQRVIFIKDSQLIIDQHENLLKLGTYKELISREVKDAT